MARDSPDYKLETGSESCSSKHNPLVPSSTLGGPTIFVFGFGIGLHIKMCSPFSFFASTKSVAPAWLRH